MHQVNISGLPGSDVSRKFEGGNHGPSRVSFFLVRDEPGSGPRPHHHSYDETFVILEGRVLVQVGEEEAEGGPGDVVVAPAGVPHRFTILAPGRAWLICIHASATMRTEFE